MEKRREELARAPRRAALALVALVGLLGLVAIGSAGHTQIDLGGRRPSYLVVDTIVSLMLVMLVLGVVVGAYAVVSQREFLVAQLLTKRRRRPFIAVGIALVLVVLLLPMRGVLHVHARQRPPSPTPPAAAGSNTRTTAAAYKPRFATAPVLLVLGFAASVAFATYLAHRQRRRAGTPDHEASLALTLAEVLGDTLDDLRAEPDPRRAVIAAYARLERTLGAFGLPRRGAEAPEEYLRRIFIDLEVNSRFAWRLTQLFARAKFSQHSVDQAMKEEAIQLLETIRTGLREADEHAREQRASIETTSPRTAW